MDDTYAVMSLHDNHVQTRLLVPICMLATLMGYPKDRYTMHIVKINIIIHFMKNVFSATSFTNYDLGSF